MQSSVTEDKEDGKHRVEPAFSGSQALRREGNHLSTQIPFVISDTDAASHGFLPTPACFSSAKMNARLSESSVVAGRRP